jgi:hypothetical protein
MVLFAGCLDDELSDFACNRQIWNGKKQIAGQELASGSVGFRKASGAKHRSVL